MRKALLFGTALLMVVAYLEAQETPPEDSTTNDMGIVSPEEDNSATALSASLNATYGFTAQSREPWEGDFWRSGQWVSLGFFGRWGSSFTLQGDLMADFSSAPLTADSFLPQVFLTWNAGDSLVATLGKQRLLWGTARVFPSLDRLEPLADPASLRKIVPGVAGARLEYLPTHWLSVQVLGLPGEKLSESRGALRLDFLAWDVDLALGVLNYRTVVFTELSGLLPLREDRNAVAGYGELSWFGDRFGLYLDAQIRSSRDRDFYLLPIGNPTGTPQIHFLSSPVPWINLTAGIQTEVPLWNRETATLLGEYHFQGDGWDQGEMETLRPLFSREQGGSLSFNPSVGTMRRHYGYLGLSGVPLAGPAVGSVSLMTGPESGFWLASVNLDWRLDSLLSLSAGYRQAGQWLAESGHPGDLLLLDWRSQLSLGLSGSF